VIAASAGAIGVGCSGAPPPPPKPAVVDPTLPSAPLPLPLAARWVDSTGTTLVGPSVANGTLLLLGGRRAVLHADGSLETEKAPTAEPLAEIVEVPSAGKRVLVARGERGVYRFDDPLGPPVGLALSDQPLARIGAAPGMVALWRAGSELPRFVDVEQGADKTFAGLPAVPLEAVAFLDTKRGAAIFGAVGLAVTADGGATWKPVAEASAGDALRARGLRIRDGSLRAFAYEDGPDGAVDVDAAKLSRAEIPGPVEGPPLLRWIRATGRDPLEAVASGGIDTPDGRVLVASHSLVARVDPKTGAIDGLVDLAHGKGSGSCGTGRSGQSAWIACPVAQESGQLFDPFGVVRIPLDTSGPLPTPAPELVRNGDAELRVSPSGGVMLLAACNNGDVGAACVRQPDGKWLTFPLDLDLAERGVAPLADGRIAFLRGIFDGDAPPPSPAGKGGGADDGASNRLHVVILGPDGKERHLAPIPFTMSRGYVHVQSPIEEDLDHTLRFVIDDGEGPSVVLVRPGKDDVEVHAVPNAAAARLHAGRGVAVTEGKVLGSLDGGATWTELPGSSQVEGAAREVAGSYEDLGQLVVSDLGAKIGTLLRVGWGPSDAAPSEPAPLSGSAPAVTWPKKASGVSSGLLTCTSQGASSGVAPLLRPAEVKTLFEGPTPRTTLAAPAAHGPRHELAPWSSSRFAMLETFALFDEETPEGAGKAPTKWTLRWVDPQEIGARQRSATLPVPKGAGNGTSLRFVSSAGSRALFGVRSSGKVHLVRVRSTGAVDVAEVANDAVPTGDVAFGEGRSEAVAWVRETLVYVWLPGERPRAVARIAAHGDRWLGPPTSSGVPLLVGGADWAALRVLPVAPLEKGAASAPPAADPSLVGWTSLGSIPRVVDAPACTAKGAAGARFTLGRTGRRGATEIDGATFTTNASIVDVRITGADSCVAAMTAALVADRVGARRTPFVRADFVAKRAEGGERGLPPVSVQRMTCSLAASEAPR
jgi:hypothetical protein